MNRPESKNESITSKANQEIKRLIKLKEKKYRDQSGLFLVENLAIIKDALTAGFPFLSLYTTQAFREKHAKDFRELKDRNQSADQFLIVEKL
jgi:TrmH family RNA methyltransferase